MANRVHPPGAACLEDMYNIDRYDTGADLPSDQREDNSLGKSCACPAGNMSERHGKMTAGHDTGVDLPSDQREDNSLGKSCTCPQGTCRNDME